jgi:VanZ family protein
MLPRSFHPGPCLWLLHTVIAAALLVLVSWSLLSTNPLATTDDTSFRFIRRIDDFLIHLSVYTIITVTLIPLVSHCQSRVQRALVGSVITHAVMTELLQTMIPRRVCDPLDLAANLLGIVLGIQLTMWWPRVLAILQKITAVERSNLQEH